jgi:HK97 family phage major capsid protein
MSKTLKTRIEEITVKSAELAKVFDEAGKELDFVKVKSIDPNGTMDTEAKVKWVREAEEKLAELNTELQDHVALLRTSENNSSLKSILDILEMPANAIAAAVKGAAGAEQTKSFGEMFTDKFDAKTMKDQEFKLEDFDIKTLFETTAGWAPESIRTGKVVDFATRPIQVSDVIPFTTTQMAAVVYMEETTYTQSAAEVAEAGQFAESAFELTERTSTVRKIAHFIPVTDEQLEDEQQVQGYLNNRMQFGLLQRLDQQLIVGDGNAPNLDGIFNRSGIQTQAKAGDPDQDAIYKALTKVRVTGRAIPNAVMIHSTDWQEIRLLRTTDGVYIWGNPSESGADTIWGLPIVQNEVLTVTNALVGDFQNFSEFAVKRGVTVKVSDSHSDFFIKGKQVIRADMRGALQVYRPAAFCTVTGL